MIDVSQAGQWSNSKTVLCPLCCRWDQNKVSRILAIFCQLAYAGFAEAIRRLTAELIDQPVRKKLTLAKMPYYFASTICDT